jgi:hypothetical protein
MRVTVSAILVLAAVLPVFSQNDAGQGIIEKTAARDTVVLSKPAPAPAKDTLILSKPAPAPAQTRETGASGNAEIIQEQSGTVIIGGERPASPPTEAYRNLDGVFKAGRALTTVGLILHASGFALTIGGAAIQSSDGAINSIVSSIGSTAMIGGPIFSCVGATRVEHGMRDAGLQAENPHVWADYGWGWLCEGGCVALILGAIGTASGITSADPNAGIAPVAMIVGAVACYVMSEVEWMKCVIHARTYVARMERKAHAAHASVSVTPYVTIKGTAGTRMNVGF